MVHRVLGQKYAKKIKQKFENYFLLKNSVNLKEMSWIRIRIPDPFFSSADPGFGSGSASKLNGF